MLDNVLYSLHADKAGEEAVIWTMFSSNSSFQNGAAFATTSTNSTFSRGHTGGYEAGYHTLLIVLASFIIVHNSFVLFLYMKKRTLRTASNLLLTSTACSDALTGLLLIPFVISSAAMFGQGLDALYFTSNVISDFLTHASVLNLLLVTLERYVSLCHPYLHPEVAKKSVIKCIVAASWLLSFIVAMIPLSWSLSVMNGEDKDIGSEYRIYSLVTLIGIFFLPTAAMVYCLITMFAVVRRFVKQDRKRGMTKQEGVRSQGKAVFVFLFMFLNMFVCWSPLMSVRLALDANPRIFIIDNVLEALFVLRCCSALLNPAIYVWCKKDFRRAFLRIVCRQSNASGAATNYMRNAQENRVTYKESLL